MSKGDRWADSANRVGFWCREGFHGFYGVLFAKDQWWLFPDHRPGMDRPVWLRTEAWLISNMIDRSRALEDVGGLLYHSMSSPEKERFASTRVAPGDLSFGINKMARAYELKVVADVHRILTDPNNREASLLHHRSYGSFSIRTDAPEGHK